MKTKHDLICYAQELYPGRNIQIPYITDNTVADRAHFWLTKGLEINYLADAVAFYNRLVEDQVDFFKRLKKMETYLNTIPDYMKRSEFRRIQTGTCSSNPVASKIEGFRPGAWVQRIIEGVKMPPVQLDHPSESSGYDWEYKHPWWGIKPGYEFFMPLKNEELVLCDPPTEDDFGKELAQTVAERFVCSNCQWYRDAHGNLGYPEGACVVQYKSGKVQNANVQGCPKFEECKPIQVGDMVRGIIVTGEEIPYYDGYVTKILPDGLNPVHVECVRVNAHSDKFSPIVLGLRFARDQIRKVQKLDNRANLGFARLKVKKDEPEQINLFSPPQEVEKIEQPPQMISLFEFAQEQAAS